MEEGEPPATAGPPKLPTWVKVSLIAGLVVLLLVGAALAFGGGEHGPGRHLPGGSTNHGTSMGNHTAPTTHHGAEAFEMDKSMPTASLESPRF